MNLLFKKIFVPLIKSGRKTETRRLKTNLKAGDVVNAKTSWFSKPFAKLRIVSVEKERFCDIKPSAAKPEGFQTLSDLLATLVFISKDKWIRPTTLKRYRSTRTAKK